MSTTKTMTEIKSSSLVGGHTVTRITNHLQPAITRSRRTVSVLSLVALCSCTAITKPYVSVGPNVPINTSFEAAVQFARTKSAEFDVKLTELERYDVTTGALLFGTGLAALGFAAYGSHPDNLIGAGLGAGAVAGTRSFLPIQDRKFAYASGSAAIECAITAFSLNVRVPDSPGEGDKPKDENEPDKAKKAMRDTTSLIGRNKYGSGPLISTLNQLELVGMPVTPPISAPDGPRIMRLNVLPSSRSYSSVIRPLDESARKSTTPSVIASMAIASARAKNLDTSVTQIDRDRRKLIEATDSLIETRSQGLISATAAIVHAVNAQILAARIDPNAALGALREQSIAFTNATKEKAASLLEAAGKTAEQGEEAETSALIAKAAKEGAGDTDSDPGGAQNAGDAAEGAKELTEKANEVARLSQQILKMIELNSSCAFGPGNTSGSSS